jgi:hypothetical protein
LVAGKNVPFPEFAVIDLLRKAEQFGIDFVLGRQGAIGPWSDGNMEGQKNLTALARSGF